MNLSSRKKESRQGPESLLKNDGPDHSEPGLSSEIIEISKKMEIEIKNKAQLFLFGSSVYLDSKENNKPRDNDIILILNDENCLQEVLDFLDKYFQIGDFDPETILDLLHSFQNDEIVFFDLPTFFKGKESTIRIITSGLFLKAIGLESEKYTCYKLIPIQAFTPKRNVPSSETIMLSGNQIRLPIKHSKIDTKSGSVIAIRYMNKLEEVYAVPRLISLAMSLHEEDLSSSQREFVLVIKSLAMKTLIQLIEKDSVELESGIIRFLIGNERFSQAFINLLSCYQSE